MSTSTSLQPIGVLAPGANLNAYVQAVSSFAILSVEEEQQLARDLHDNGNLDAARKLVMAHLRFVVHIARSYNGYGLPLGDLIQEGNVGLMKAVKRFDPDKGVRLVSFAVHWIKAEIHEFILRNWRIVKIATTKAQRKLFFNLRGAKKRLAWLSNDEAEAVALDLGVDVKQVREMEGRLASYDAGFDASDDDEDDNYVAPANYLEDNRYDPAARLEEANWEEASVNGLEMAMEKLDDRSRVILQRRWLNDDKATLHDLAAEYGVSAERIRQLEKNAMNKVKAMMLEA
ncbi:RNA polymerase sigma factor RpoH [Cellvibrio japonicus]|uniref:RNA polymerase sigma factor RpoH n=1 Tax=Cellvibrio japonicus (strain Ueda107) TaxID=498211 RepID=B3PG43_CELJU|nr:RNA polymerase sigma factor RpoH [Cellvibrio japonicus]ACE85863.1 alternative sigma factor RpoH [Cellvibrio japonicus Ueda107]QEI13722.1 RNA polymerase sigma factor RpoH [Cellvibrio japonicus]QEI17296.1 RNA polymerase sigma factor RpoH [Cellvibrio japonicus]QEI20873.1 RNA polymerase sigma factor RpoH [Cellvibrio japonicus]